mmetsp:Transcript_108751/g.351118  ORF Transcript_108751/g.351118 Transcript_108751/m.351118 type:complete len:262 (+) Transcript_108751:173-958(+)
MSAPSWIRDANYGRGRSVFFTYRGKQTQRQKSENKPPTHLRHTDHEAIRHIQPLQMGYLLLGICGSAAAAIAKKCQSNRALAVDLRAGSSGHREEIQVQLLEDRRNVEQSPTLLHKPVHDAPLNGKPDRQYLARCLEAQPWSHMAATQLPKRSAIVALATENIGVQTSVVEGGTEGFEDVLAVLLGAMRAADATRAIEGEIRMPMRAPLLRARASTAADPILLQGCLCNLQGSRGVLRLSDYGERCRNTIVGRRRQHETLW